MATLYNGGKQNVDPGIRVYAYAVAGEVSNFYVGNDDGDIYKISDTYEAEGAVAIPAYYRTKQLDFTDEYEQLIGMWKTVEHVTVTYRDVMASTPLSIHISDDGGVTWASKHTTVGTGDGKIKTKDFWFLDSDLCTSDFFFFILESTSSDKTFEWLQIVVWFLPAGPFYRLS
jgi:hypothetical protein